jgi:hypothetical protein
LLTPLRAETPQKTDEHLYPSFDQKLVDKAVHLSLTSPKEITADLVEHSLAAYTPLIKDDNLSVWPLLSFS